METIGLFKNFDGKMSLSFELLRYKHVSDGTEFDERDHVVCLYAHFIDQNWKLRKWAVDYFNADSSAFHEEWVFGNKKFTLILSDTVCDVPSELTPDVETRIEEHKLFICCSKTISVMVQDAFNRIEDINVGVLDLYSTQPKIPSWHFKHSELKQAVKLWSRRKATSGGADCYDVPSLEIWKKVESVCKVVDSIYEVSNALFETKYSTANVYLYHLHQLYKILIQYTKHSDGFIKEVSKCMLKKFMRSYWKRMFIWLAITAALDPRFKMKYVEFICSQEPKDRILSGAAVFEVIEEKFSEYVIRFPEKEGSISDSSPSSLQHVNQNFSVLQDYHQFIQNQSDLVRYFGEPVLPWSQDFDVLTWWSTASLKYPTLTRMARDFLAVPLSTATSYEAFYTKPKPVDEQLVGLKQDLMHALMYTQSWSLQQ